MNVHFPHREPIVVHDHELRVVRRFPGESEITVRANERVGPETILGKADPRAVAIRVHVADQLDVAPADVTRHLMRPVGSTFAAGEPLARARRGVRSVVAASPIAGTLVEVDPIAGVALVAPTGAGEMRALLAGDVERVDGKTSVTIRTVGSRILGIVGLGNPTAGPIAFAVERPDQELTVERVTPALAGTIVIGGSHAGAAALKKLAEVGAAGLIVGGLIEREIATAFGWQSEDRLAPWRSLPGARALAEGLPVPLPLIATEGFGSVAMNGLAFELLGERNGRRAVLFPATRTLGQSSRPEIVIPDPDALDDDGQVSEAVLVPGVPVRLTDQSALGRTGVVASEPAVQHQGDGVAPLVVAIDFPDGIRRQVRATNVEILN